MDRVGVRIMDVFEQVSCDIYDFLGWNDGWCSILKLGGVPRVIKNVLHDNVAVTNPLRITR
jgi:hypothetical protein